MANLTRRSFLGILAALPVVGVAVKRAGPKPRVIFEDGDDGPAQIIDGMILRTKKVTAAELRERFPDPVVDGVVQHNALDVETLDDVMYATPPWPTPNG